MCLFLFLEDVKYKDQSIKSNKLYVIDIQYNKEYIIYITEVNEWESVSICGLKFNMLQVV